MDRFKIGMVRGWGDAAIGADACPQNGRNATNRHRRFEAGGDSCCKNSRIRGGSDHIGQIIIKVRFSTQLVGRRIIELGELFWMHFCIAGILCLV